MDLNKIISEAIDTVLNQRNSDDVGEINPNMNLGLKSPLEVE